MPDPLKKTGNLPVAPPQARREPDATSTRKGRIAGFCVGMASILFQSLLFQRYFAAFDGGEWSIAVFFFTWLVWVAAGASLGSALPEPRPNADRLVLCLLLYIPLVPLQYHMIDSARQWAGVTAYEIYGALHIIPWSLLANAPLSLLTGLLFVSVARSYGARSRTAVARTAIWEAVGSCAGGIGFSLLSAIPFSPVRIYLLGTIAITLSVFALQAGARGFRRMLRAASLVPLIGSAVLLLLGTDEVLMDQINRRTWSRLLPPEGYAGSFITPSSHYLHGYYHDQFNLLAWSRSIETLPDLETGELAAITVLAQNPEPANALIIGPGSYPICQTLRRWLPDLPITWINPDPLYAPRLLDSIPPGQHLPSRRFRTPAQAPRHFLLNTTNTFDLVVLNLPPDDTYAMNSYLTDHFLSLLKQRLEPAGVLLTRNIPISIYDGIEHTLTGASIYYTQNRIFSNVTVAAGISPWLLASDQAPLSTDPDLLARRVEARGLPSDALWSLYDTFQTPILEHRFEQATRHHGSLLNNELLFPRTPLFATLLKLRKAMPNMPEILAWTPFLTGRLWLLLLLLLTAYIPARMLPGSRTDRPLRPGDCYALVLCAGFSGFALNMILLILFQALFGSLYLAIGVISALYMLGYFLGGRLWLHVLAGLGLKAALTGTLLLHATVCASIVLTPLMPRMWLFGALFLAAGFSSGCFTPAAERALRLERRSSTAIAKHVARMDHLGASLGALLAGLLLIPLMGVTHTLVVLGFLPVALLCPIWLKEKTKGATMHKKNVATISWAILLILLALASAWLVKAAREARHDELDAIAQMADAFPALTPEPPSAPSTAAPPVGADGSWTEHHLEMETGLLFPYARKHDSETDQTHYRFPTRPLAPDITGYAGSIPMTATVDQNGTLLHVAFHEHNETPQFFDPVETWTRETLLEQNAQTAAFKETDALSGATASAVAVRDSLHQAISAFFRLLEGTEPGSPPPETTSWDIPDDPLPGRSRDINVPRFRRMIDEGKLSDHPARHTMGEQ